MIKSELFCGRLFFWEIYMMEKEILKLLPDRPDRSHKGMFGRVLCIAGNINMAGASYLCGYAALRTGAGLVRIFTREENRVILQTLLPEAILTTFSSESGAEEKLNEALAWADTVAIGPGLGKEAWASMLVRKTLAEFHGPMVLDADGINLAAGHREWLTQHEGPLILTPHVGEYGRLMDQPAAAISADIPGQARTCAEKYQCICVLKDAPTAVASSDGTCWMNSTGNNGMSTAGSGDVLTGILAGLLGQKVKAEDAARLGVWLHGRSGDLAARTEGTYGLMARHLIQYLPEAMKGEQK